jgi:uncharacterized membrane protein YdbT with pleckstrin-like domain
MLKLDGERIILRQRMHWAFFALPIVAGTLLGLPLLLLSIAVSKLSSAFGSHLPGSFIWFLLVIAVMPLALFLTIGIGSYMRCKVVLTSMQFSYATGLLFRRAGKNELSDLQAISLQQSFFGRLFDFGTVIISTTDGSQLILPYMPRVSELLPEIQNTITAFHERKQHGTLSA